MSKLPRPVAAKQVASKSVLQISIFYAVILIVFAVAQLYSFDEFMELVASPAMGIAAGVAGFLVPFLIFAEVFGLAFLLRIPLSPAFRWVSLGLSVLVALIWLFLTSWIVFGAHDVATVGFLGAVVDLIPGAWAVCVSGALVVLSVWAAWGLWPGERAVSSRSRKK